MKLLITGAGGQLGREWIEACKIKNIDYHGFTSSELDICSEAAVTDALDRIQPDTLINCAAYTKVDQAETDSDTAKKVNTIASGILADSCKERGIKLVHYSTDYVFRGTLDERTLLPDGYTEDHPKDPVNVYGQTKSDGEDLIVASGADHLILRVSWLCGRFGNNFMRTMLRLAESRDHLNVVNDQYGCPAFAGPVVDQSLHLITSNANGVYHLGSAGLITWHDFAKAIFEHMRIQVKVDPVSSLEFKTAAQRPHFSKLDTRKAESDGATIPYWRDALQDILTKIQTNENY